jgi:dynein heavy chain
MLEHLMDELKQIQLKIDKPVVDMDSLGSVMFALEEIRKKQSDFSLQTRPVNEMYKLLETYFVDIMDKDESDNKDALDNCWVGLVDQADTVRAEMHEKKAEFKQGLIYNVKNLIVEVDDFREAFVKYGPSEPGLAPNEALERLKAKRDEFEVIKKKYDTANAGEALFGLPHQEYAKLVETENEINLLDKLYGLYQKTQSTFGQWNEAPFTSVQEDCAKMIEVVENFQRDCLRLPGHLKKWLTYTHLKNEIDDMIELLPVVEGLAKDSIRDRHWEEVIELTGCQIPYDQETFVLK